MICILSHLLSTLVCLIISPAWWSGQGTLSSARPPPTSSSTPWDSGAGGLSYAALIEEARQLAAAKEAMAKSQAGHKKQKKEKKDKKEKKEKKDKKEKKVIESVLGILIGSVASTFLQTSSFEDCTPCATG